jgi:hypothetical protein
VTAAATKKTIGNRQYSQITTLVNSASTALPIGLPPKGAKFCQTSNILLVRRRCRCALLWLYFNSSAAGHLVAGWLLVHCWSVVDWLSVSHWLCPKPFAGFAEHSPCISNEGRVQNL